MKYKNSITIGRPEKQKEEICQLPVGTFFTYNYENGRADTPGVRTKDGWIDLTTGQPQTSTYVYCERIPAGTVLTITIREVVETDDIKLTYSQNEIVH